MTFLAFSTAKAHALPRLFDAFARSVPTGFFAGSLVFRGCRGVAENGQLLAVVPFSIIGVSFGAVTTDGWWSLSTS
jgi:hypothetical protein